jgi:phage N-6-adenine-methyltransferase
VAHLVGFKAKNHPQQTRYAGSRRHVDDRALPPEQFAALHERFQFTLDVAASDSNHKLPRYCTIERSGLAESWVGERVYCNPPYSDVRPWIEKAWHEAGGAQLIVMLLPANRTEQSWWQELIEPRRDQPGSRLTTEFLPGRIRFLKPGRREIGPNERPPFGCVLCIWNG